MYVGPKKSVFMGYFPLRRERNFIHQNEKLCVHNNFHEFITIVLNRSLKISFHSRIYITLVTTIFHECVSHSHGKLSSHKKSIFW